jgi:hypothetical protein
MDITREQLVDALDELGIQAQLVTPEPEFPGVNVWARNDGLELAAFTTVWFPGWGPHSGDFVWGPSFEHHAPADTPANRLAELVAATLG